MTSVKVFKDIIAQRFGNHWSVVEHDYWTSCDQGLSVWKIINDLLVPVLLLVRCPRLYSFVQQLVFITAKTGCF